MLFANSFGNDWTYDDFSVVVNNPDIRSLKGFLGNSIRGRPIREITYLFDYMLFGLNPYGYHIQNIFWHGLNACLIFALVLRLGGDKAVAWISSLLFLAHPVTVEVVASIGHRKDSLCLAFCLSSFLAFIEAYQPFRKKVIWLVLSFVLSLVAYHAKENALALPFIFIAYKISFLFENNRILHKIWPYVLMLAAGTVIFFHGTC
jgi:4-amino-4-deoxy-L-arabinose transferase-like glycosyltransferase